MARKVRMKPGIVIGGDNNHKIITQKKAEQNPILAALRMGKKTFETPDGRTISLALIVNQRRANIGWVELGRMYGFRPEKIRGYFEPLVQKINDFKEAKADILAGIQSDILGSITKEDIAKASLLQKATTVAIFSDKEDKARGKSDDAKANYVQIVQQFFNQPAPALTAGKIIDMIPENIGEVEASPVNSTPEPATTR